LNGEKQVWVFPLMKLVRTVGGGFRREKVMQTVTCLSDLPKKFGIRLVYKRTQQMMSCDSTKNHW